MGTIKTIRMSGHGVFQEQHSSFEDCVIANFIYGPNGSGKSTISNLLRNQDDLDSVPSSIEWNEDSSEIIVYNKEWREANFRDQQNFPGVFTLGSDSVNAQKDIDGLLVKLQKTQEKISSANKQLEDKQKQIDDAMESFRDSVWNNILKPNERSLEPVLTGYRNSKSKFALKLLEKPGEETSITIDELEAQIANIFSGEPNIYERIDIDSFRALIDNLGNCETCNIWELAIIGNQDVGIADLIGFLDNSDWVKQGMVYIGEMDVCPFCQQHTITSDLKTQFESFFDNQYETNLRKVKDELSCYRSTVDALLMNFKALSANPFIIACSNQSWQLLEAKILEIRTATKENIKLMEDKEKEPSRRVTISSCGKLYEELLQQITIIDKAINEHNETMSNISKEKKRLVNDAWATLRKIGAAAIQSHEEAIKKLEGAKKGLETTIREQKGYEKEINKKIVETRKGITSIQPTVDEINRSLLAYGFDGFSIKPSGASENAYQIVRSDGSPAGKTLSEGEETFVAFLYFMQLIKGSVDPNRFAQEKIVVIDDPICSLDSTVLYIVSCMVKQLIDDAKKNQNEVKQVFVLTHNAFFHKEASFSKGKAYDDRNTKYWTIQKRGNKSFIEDHGSTNPIKTSYELLWEEVKDRSASTIALQNSMRRIIENYFRMLGKDKSDKIENRFETIEDRIICRSLFAWMNDGSHSIPDDLYIDSYSESPEKYREVFKRIFEVSENSEHYKMMMGEACKEAVDFNAE